MSSRRPYVTVPMKSDATTLFLKETKASLLIDVVFGMSFVCDRINQHVT